MTLEQAINHLEEELNTKQDWSCVACKEEHKQLLEWLKELQEIKSAEPSEAMEKLEMLSDCAEAMKEAPSFNWIEYAQTEAELDLKLHFAYLDVKQTLLKAQEQEKVINELKTLIKYADLNKQKIISLAVLKNALKEVL